MSIPINKTWFDVEMPTPSFIFAGWPFDFSVRLLWLVVSNVGFGMVGLLPHALCER